MASVQRIEGKRGVSFRIAVSCGYDEKGRKLVQTKTFRPDPGLSPKRAQKAAEEFARAFEQKVLRGEPTSEPTLKQAFEMWKEDTFPALQPSTQQIYLQAFSHHILPALGDKKVCDLRPTVLSKFLRDLSGDGGRKDGKSGGYAKSTVQKSRNALSGVLRFCAENGYLSTNPMTNVRPIRVEKTGDDLKVWTPSQARAFLAFIEEPYIAYTDAHARKMDSGSVYEISAYTTPRIMPLQLRVLLQLTISCGLRKGEVVALRWGDINFEQSQVTVSRSACIVDHVQITKEPKTESSKRTVPIPLPVLARLNDLRKEQEHHAAEIGDLWHGSDYVFTQFSGVMMNYSTPYTAFTDAVRRYNAGKDESEQLPLIPFHGLRHTAASVLIEAGIPIPDVSRLLGHANVQITTAIYTHSVAESLRPAADLMEGLFFGKEA